MSHILICYLGSQGGGVLDNYEICRALVSRGQKKYSAMISSRNPMKERYKTLPLRSIFIVDTHRRSIASLIFETLRFKRIAHILRIIKDVKPEILFFTHDHPWLMIVLLFSRIFVPRTKIVFIRHNPIGFDSVGSKISDSVINYVSNFLARNSDYVITLSNSVREEIIKLLGIHQNRIFVLRLGAYHSLSENWKHRGFYRNNLLRLLFFGRILPYKGLDVLVRAYEIIKRKNLPAHLIIAGEGKIDKSVLDKIRENKVQLINRWIGDDELKELLAETDVMILPYKKASQSGPASIALAFGIPVIATKVGGLSEQVKDGVNGILIEPSSDEAIVDGIVEAVEKLISEPSLLETLSKGAVTLRDGDFSWERIASDIEKIFDVILCD